MTIEKINSIWKKKILLSIVKIILTSNEIKYKIKLKEIKVSSHKLIKGTAKHCSSFSIKLKNR